MPKTKSRFRTPVATVMLCALLLGQVRAAAQAAENGVAPSSPRVAYIEISGNILDGPPPLAWVPQQDMPLSLQRISQLLDTVAGDEHIIGVIIDLDRPAISLTQAMEIGQAVDRVRGAGKRVIVFGETFNQVTYALACRADEIVLHHKGELMLAGISVEEMYLAGLLEKIGVRADMVQIGQYKGAADPLSRTGPSDAWSENIDRLLDDIYLQLKQQMIKGRGMTAARVEKILADIWGMTDEDYLSGKLIDRLSDRDWASLIKASFGKTYSLRRLTGKDGAGPAENPLVLLQRMMQPGKRAVRSPSIAVVRAAGPIVHGKSRHMAANTGLLGGSPRIGSHSLAQTLDELRTNRFILGVVLRIDSPGGSALASELVWQAVWELAKTKPVYVSVGSMAASGGYYIACAGTQVFVSPASIVGSIGVVGGKLVLGGLYEKIGLNIHSRSRGPMGGIFSSVEEFTPEQRTLIKASMQRVYDQFRRRVTTGRGKKLADFDAVAQGRLFTGRQAVENGLVDQLGGLTTALNALAEDCAIDLAKTDVVYYPQAMSLGEYLESLFDDQAASPISGGIDSPLHQARALLGPHGWQQLQQVYRGLLQLRGEPVLTLMPTPLLLRSD